MLELNNKPLSNWIFKTYDYYSFVTSKPGLHYALEN